MKGVVCMPKRKITGKTSGNKRVAAKRDVKAGAKPYVRFSDKLTGSLEEIGRIIEQNKETMDSIQDIGLELTRAAGLLQATASRYVGMVDSLLDTAVPIMRTIPIVPPKTLEMVTELQELANNILEVCGTADRVITDVGAGLEKGDIAKLSAHTGDLQKMTQALQRVLPS
jgi:hypothetical protein